MTDGFRELQVNVLRTIGILRDVQPVSFDKENTVYRVLVLFIKRTDEFLLLLNLLRLVFLLLLPGLFFRRSINKAEIKFAIQEPYASTRNGSRLIGFSLWVFFCRNLDLITIFYEVIFQPVYI